MGIEGKGNYITSIILHLCNETVKNHYHLIVYA